MLSIAIAYSGIALIFAGGEIATGEAVALGAALVVICAFFYGLSQLLSKSLIGKLGGALYTCVAMSAAGGAIFTHFLMANWEGGIGVALDLPPRIFSLGAMIAVFSTVLPSFFINIALGRIGPQAVAIMGMLSPVATIIVAIIVLGEPFGPLDALGTAVTMVGIGLYTVMDRRAKTVTA
ncbi:MAG: DMT family transporter [Robiginitomaculum sp.]